MKSIGTDISLIITISVFVLLIILTSTLFVVRFSHPEDDTGFAPKIIAILCFSFAFLGTIPIPISNAALSDQISINDKITFYLFTLIGIGILLVIVPFSLLFFKSAFVAVGTPLSSARIWHAFVGVVVVLSVFSVITVPLYLFANANKEMDFIEMCIASVTFVGWFLFSVLLGIGFVALPASLISTWYYRPTAIEVEEYDRKRIDLGNKAKTLREIGENIKNSKSGNMIERRNKRNSFVESVAAIKQDYLYLQTAYHFKGGNPIWPWFTLFLGFFAILFNMVWVAQIVLNLFLKELIADPLGKILEITSFEGFFILSFSLYMLFAFFLLTATSYGLLHVSAYAPFLLAGYKLVPRGTYNDSFLVNSALLLLMSFPALHFMAKTIPTYSAKTYISTYFEKVEKNPLFGAFYPKNVFYYIIIAFCAVSAVLYFAWPPKNGSQMISALEKMEN